MLSLIRKLFCFHVKELSPTVEYDFAGKPNFGTCAYLFLPDEGSCYAFSTQNNCREILAFYGVILQSDIQPYFKMPICGAPFSY